MGTLDRVLLEKLDQVPGILAELDLDAWLIFVRETSALHDPSLDVVVGTHVTWMQRDGQDRPAPPQYQSGATGTYEDAARRRAAYYAEQATARDRPPPKAYDPLDEIVPGTTMTRRAYQQQSKAILAERKANAEKSGEVWYEGPTHDKNGRAFVVHRYQDADGRQWAKMSDGSSVSQGDTSTKKERDEREKGDVRWSEYLNEWIPVSEWDRHRTPNRSSRIGSTA